MPNLTTRPKFVTRPILLRTEQQRATAQALISNLPLDYDNPIEILVREQVKARGMDANARMWAGPLRDIAEQGYVQGRSYSAEIWHEFFKKEYLPDENDSADLAKPGYIKWDYTPSGDRVLIGSTTQLTKRGFALHLMQIEAFGSGIGVQFSISPSERIAA